jgi:hypothetical protein
MIHFVGCKRDSLHEPECLREILELEPAVQTSLHQTPSVKRPQAHCSFLLR